ncbi:succinoglycan biosynthesis protein ExoO [Novosphingobium chloroacetimidivorans]|uniref:Succinoglycan biosynthesis protein ExoO n=1 Tax=Novosphingobium chloroacetimidivorans TaxID=1428314 RepID=A0A7W7K5W1_9SPHN|nr:glycosyltransferase family 2 protein [Novosphingobium chloroacetimidivorans]MBB4856844.1 succinoglycan biosynthesis protein ExoO [Novosphingobium chloroacetimidivorans]
MSAPPTVSVVIPAYNAAHCVARAIHSVQAQTLQSFEIVVVDDASQDETRAVVRRLAAADGRIRLLELERNGGPSAARNAGLAAATGTWTALLDADDAFRPERLATLCTLATQHDLDAIGDDIVLFDDVAGMEVGEGGYVRASGVHRISLAEYLRTTTYRVGMAEALWREDRPISLLKLVMRTAFLRSTGLTYSARYRYCEDFLFYYDLLRCGARLGLLDRAMYLYTEPLGSISRRNSPHSRTVADRQSVIDAVDELLERDSALAPVERRLLLQRRRSTGMAMRYSAFRRETAHCGKAELITRVLREPALWCRFARELRHGLASRVRHNRLYRRKSAEVPARA